ncbi:hypothetical protein SAMN05216227_1010110 [Pseudorhodobacter antarcticus]|jgi:hypothetical protein|uniref:SnoaL-like domain-containing protein n=1 Tax=Pseudorhodobacter antarcticus TaxID=1077947 RepID=A0A1H8FEM1_9RHOB|nr:hypothetical protein [Pseudorhodobacter antarcticus]SEN29498.1 hypothetical protein SAMN05216227_1010110 [Pseudorhodobacter antarcticus]
MQAAEAILQAYLDKVADAVMHDDWPRYLAAMTLPFHLVTHNGNIALTTEADLRATYDGFRQTLQVQRVTDYIRLVQTAKQIDDDLITGSYITHLLSGGQRLLDPFTSQITLRRSESVWCAVSITNALVSSRWPLLLHPSPSQIKGPDQ